MNKNIITLHLDIDLEVSDRLLDRLQSNKEELNSFIIHNAFKNNSRRIKGVDYEICRNKKLY